MEATILPITQVFPNIGQVKGLNKNPRFIRDEKYKALLQSIKDDPEMLELRELIVYDTNDPDLGYVVVGGNMRYRAMKELGYKEVPCKVLHTGFPIEKLRRIVLKDNGGFGEWDFESLVAEWNLEEIGSAAIDIPDLGEIPTLEATAEPAQQQQEQPAEQQEQSAEQQQRLESKGEIDVTQYDVKQTLKLDFTPNEYMFVLDRLREFGDDYSQSLLAILGYEGESEEENRDYDEDEHETEEWEEENENNAALDNLDNEE